MHDRRGKSLRDLARVVRSKNSGPFELTLDVIFAEPDVYRVVKASGVLSRAAIARLYRIPEDRVLVAEFFDPALAFKATIVRPQSSGTVGETDTYGGQQHAPLLDLRVNVPADVA